MEAPRLPTINDLDFSSELMESFFGLGGKSGILNWISRKTKIPVMLHMPLTMPTMPIIKSFAQQNERGVLVRSDNYCEILPGTEGLFNSYVFYEEDDVNDKWQLDMLKKRPICPKPHLKKDWPKNQKEMKLAIVNNLSPEYYCNLIEHPNQPNTFWMTITDSVGRKLTLHPGIDKESRYYQEQIQTFQDKTNGGLEKITEAARNISELDGFDRRYAKQMEFILRGKEFYLAQAKIFYPKNLTTPKTSPERTGEELYQTIGVFDIEAIIENLDEGRIEDQPVIRFVSDLRESAKKGRHYRKNVEAVIFKDATGLLEHKDMPYLLYAQGIAVGDCMPQALDKNGKPFFPNFKHGQRAHIKSDGHYLYVLD